MKNSNFRQSMMKLLQYKQVHFFLKKKKQQLNKCKKNYTLNKQEKVDVMPQSQASSHK